MSRALPRGPRCAASVAGLLAAVAAALAWSVVSAGPALAHASLTTATPAQGSRTDTAPTVVRLTFSEAVDLSSRSMEVLDAVGRRVETGSPYHPSGDSTALAVNLKPGLPRGAYTVIWRVASADSHPAASSYSFGVGVTPPPSRADVDASASSSVSAVHGLARILALGSAAVLVGGTFFCLTVWPAGRSSGAAQKLVQRSWYVALLAACVLLLVQGPYGSGGGLTGVADPRLLAGTLTTRYGQLLLLRLVLLVCAAGVLRMFFRGVGRPAVLGGLGVAFVFTFAFSEHSGQGGLVVLAVPSDMAHTAAASVWLGGLCMLFAVLRGRSGSGPVAGLGGVLSRWSRTAMIAVGILIVTGTFQAWREVRYSEALLGTGYGRLLIGKLAVVALMLTVALGARALTRHLVGTSRERLGSTLLASTRSVDVLAGAPLASSPHSLPAGWQAPTGSGVTATGAASTSEGAPPDEVALHGLRRRVILEAAGGLTVLTVTAMLVDTIPAKDSYDTPFSARVTATDTTGAATPVIIDVDSTRAGLTAMHVYAYTSYGDPLPLASVSASLAIAGQSTPATRVDLSYAGPGHAATDVLLVPRPGDWTITVQLFTGDGAALSATADYHVRG